MQAPSGSEYTRDSKSGPPAAQRPNTQSTSMASPARVPGAALTAKPEPPQLTATQGTAQPNASSRRKTATVGALLAIAVLVALGVARQRRIVSQATDPQMPLNTSPSGPPLTATQAMPATVPASAPTTVFAPVGDSTGPLNSLAADLRREYSEETYREELKRAETQQQTLWDQGIAELQDGQVDAAERALRNILVLPASGRHWTDAERYVDQVIPQRRLEQHLWAEAQMQSASVERGHLLKQIKALDEVMAEGGPHEQQARQMRDAVIRQIVRDNARRSGQVDPTLSQGYETQLAGLETQLVNLALKGDAAALEGLQELRPKFKALADAGGPLAMDARDYLNSVIPKTQKQIQDNLAATASELSANAEYEHAVKDYARAVATQNPGLLRGRVLAVFQQIAESGGIRAKEAERYTHVLIPAALKKSGK